jgi:DNA-directed RNA polymerase specialized sigma24 family protein
MRADEEHEFREFVSGRLQPLMRSAYLLCGDRHGAEDLVFIAVGKLFRAWRRVSRVDQPDAYLRRMLVNAWLDERRRPWRRREVSTDELPQRSVVSGPDIGDRQALMEVLRRLPARRREQSAEILGCTTGTLTSC